MSNPASEHTECKWFPHHIGACLNLIPHLKLKAVISQYSLEPLLTFTEMIQTKEEINTRSIWVASGNDNRRMQDSERVHYLLAP